MSTKFHEFPTSRYNITSPSYSDWIPNLSPRYAHEKKIRIVPVKLSEVYPPQPPGRAGQQQNANILKDSWSICFVNCRTCWRSFPLLVPCGYQDLYLKGFAHICWRKVPTSGHLRDAVDTHIMWSWILKQHQLIERYSMFTHVCNLDVSLCFSSFVAKESIVHIDGTEKSLEQARHWV